MKAYVINLLSRPDRLDEFRKQYFPFDVERFTAIADIDGHKGCSASHVAVLKHHMETSGVFPLIVFEDDCKIINDWFCAERSFFELPDKWDVLYFGATLNEPLKKHSEYLFELKNAWATHAIMYGNKEVVEFIINNHNTRKVDVFYKEQVQEKFNCFIAYPLMATQSNSKSNITKNQNFNEQLIVERYKKYAK